MCSKLNEKWFDLDSSPMIQAINEAYFGETPEIQKCQKLLSKFRDKFAGPKYTYKTEDIVSKELRDFENAMANTFGFEVFSLSINHTQMVNACTMPVGMCYDEMNTKDNIVITKSGYKFKSSARYCCWVSVYGGLIFDRETFSDREVMALLLHEIGHNFSAKNGTINVFKNISNAITIVGCIIATMFSPILGASLFLLYSSAAKNYYVKISNDMVKNYPNLSKAVNAMEIIFKAVVNLIGEADFVASLIAIPTHYIGYILGRARQIAMTTMTNPTYPIRLLLTGYPDEQFADGFPTLYGYGPDLNTCLAKLENVANHGYATSKWLEKHAPILLAIYDLASLPLLVLIKASDEHPVTVERIKNNTRILQEEAKKTHNPKLIKRINEDIKRMESDMNEYYDPKKISSKMEKHSVLSNIFTRVYYGIVLNLFKGDFKHHIYGAIFNVNKSLTTEGDKQHIKETK